MKQQRNNTWQRGAILIMTAFLLPLTIAMAGTAVDIGQAYLLKSKLQNATDAAAVAGAYELGNSKKVNTTVEDYLEKNTKYKGNLSYSDSEMPPNDENEAIYKTDQMSDELDVTMRANVKTAFVKLFGVDTIAVTALSKAKVEDEGDFTDEMFKYGLVAANESPSDYNPQNRSDWTQGSTKTAILIDHNDVVINGDIRTNGKIALTNTEKSFNARVNGTIFASRDVKNQGTPFTDTYWEGNHQVTKTVNPSVWGTYEWSGPHRTTFSMMGKDGEPINTETQPTATTRGEQNSSQVQESMDDIDISLDKNPSMKKLIDSWKNMTPAEREQNHVYYDDNPASHSGQWAAHGFSSSHNHTFPALCPQQDTNVPSGATNVDPWDRYYTSIVVYNNINVSFEDSNEPGPNDYAVIVSLHGNIHIPINHLKLFRGILYAPNGKVVIDNMGDIEGNVIANQIEIKHNMTVSSKTMTSIGKSSRTGGRKVRLIN